MTSTTAFIKFIHPNFQKAKYVDRKNDEAISEELKTYLSDYLPQELILNAWVISFDMNGRRGYSMFVEFKTTDPEEEVDPNQVYLNGIASRLTDDDEMVTLYAGDYFIKLTLAKVKSDRAADSRQQPVKRFDLSSIKTEKKPAEKSRK